MFDNKFELVICKLTFKVFYTLIELSIGIRAGTLILASLPWCDPSPHIEMDSSQSLNASPYFDGSNYAFWKVWIRTDLCSIDKAILGCS